jgi:HD-like signal output (HDOD) protein
LATLDNDRVSLGEISALIKLDAAFTAEVLRLANSAVFSIRFEVLNVLHAVSVLGLSRVHSLVLTVALRDYLISMPFADLVRQCWRHNLATALAAEELARRQWVDHSLAYTAGLLHDVGRLALVASDPGVYSGIVERCRCTSKTLSALEQSEFGVDAADARRILTERWNLPSLISEVACCQSEQSTPARNSVAAIVHDACAVDCHFGFAIAAVPSWLPAPSPDVDALARSVALRLNMFECEFMHPCPGH